MEEKVSGNQIALKNGLIVGLIGILINTVNYMFVIYESSAGRIGLIVVSLAISVYFIIASHNTYKEGNNGFMSYGKGLGIGTVLSLVSAVIGGTFQVIYTNFIDTAPVDYQMEQQTQAMLDRGMSQQAIDEAMNSPIAEFFQNPAVGIVLAIIIGTFFGFVLSLIISAITKKSDPSLEI